jgi:pimeloyl-ACP methyl ester carboxylesterase
MVADPRVTVIAPRIEAAQHKTLTQKEAMRLIDVAANTQLDQFINLALYTGIRLGVEKAILHGVSWGGLVVQQFALDYQEKCAALILDSTSSEVNLSASENWYQQSIDAPRGKGSRVVKPEHMDSFVTQSRAIASTREHPFTPRLHEIKCSFWS